MTHKDNDLDIFVPIRGRTGSDNVSKREFEYDFKSIPDKIKPRKPYTSRLSVSVIFYFTGFYVGDIDNLLKTLFDALERDGYFKNDRQIKKISAEICEGSLLEGISIAIKKI